MRERVVELAIVGLMLDGPVGMLLAGSTGAALGAIAESVNEYGVDNQFIQQVGCQLQPASSALFILLRHLVEANLLAALKGVDGQLIKTTLSTEGAGQLARMLSAYRGRVYGRKAEPAV